MTNLLAQLRAASVHHLGETMFAEHPKILMARAADEIERLLKVQRQSAELLAEAREVLRVEIDPDPARYGSVESAVVAITLHLQDIKS